MSACSDVWQGEPGNGIQVFPGGGDSCRRSLLVAVVLRMTVVLGRRNKMPVLLLLRNMEKTRGNDGGES